VRTVNVGLGAASSPCAKALVAARTITESATLRMIRRTDRQKKQKRVFVVGDENGCPKYPTLHFSAYVA